MTIRDIETELLTIHNRLCVRTNLDQACRAGELLLEGKRIKGHGNYGAWVRSLGISTRTARVYCQCHRGQAVFAKRQGSAVLTIDSFLHLLKAGRKAERAQRAKELARGAAKAPDDPALIHGEALDWLKAQPSGSVPFIVSDPPYGLGLTYGDWTEPDNPRDYWAWFQPYWREMVRVVQPGGAVVLCQAYTNLAHLLRWFPGAKIVPHCMVVRGLRWWDPLVWWTKPGKPLMRQIGFTDYLLGSVVGFGGYIEVHPCAKSLPDCREMVRRYTAPGCLVADPFCGVGTIPLACKLEGRQYVGVERVEKFARLARKRLADEGKTEGAHST